MSSIVIVPGLVLWCGLVVALTRPLFDPERETAPRILVKIRRDLAWLLPTIAGVGMPLGFGLAMWKTVGLNQQVGPLGGAWTLAFVSATLGAAAFSAQAHLPGRPKKKVAAKMFDRNERRKLAKMMADMPEKQLDVHYIPVHRRKRAVDLDEVLKRRPGAQRD